MANDAAGGGADAGEYGRCDGGVGGAGGGEVEDAVEGGGCDGGGEGCAAGDELGGGAGGGGALGGWSDQRKFPVGIEVPRAECGDLSTTRSQRHPIRAKNARWGLRSTRTLRPR